MIDQEDVTSKKKAKTKWADRSPRYKKFVFAIWGFVLVMAALLIWGFNASSSDTKSSSPSSSSAESEYVGGLLGCTHGRNVLSDITDAVLLESEIVVKLREVRDNTQFAEPSIKNSALRMVQSAVANDAEGFGTAAGNFLIACGNSGY